LRIKATVFRAQNRPFIQQITSGCAAKGQHLLWRGKAVLRSSSLVAGHSGVSALIQFSKSALICVYVGLTQVSLLHQGLEYWDELNLRH
jgi:hypothetical protein